MNETSATTEVQSPKGANGQPTNGQPAPAVTEPAAGPARDLEASMAALFERVKALPAEKQLELQKEIESASLPIIEKKVGLVDPAKKPSSIDPGDFPPSMIPIAEGPPLWTLEAMEASGYLHEKKRVFPRLDALLLDRVEKDGRTVFAFELALPLLCAETTGKLVQADRKKVILAHGCHAMRHKLAHAFEYQRAQQGYCRVAIRPVATESGELAMMTLLSGLREPCLDIRVEEDPEVKGRPKLYSREKAT
jgi:hypothetical protein